MTDDDVDRARALLDAHPDYRALERLPPPSRWPLAPRQGPVRRAAFVDCETTGLELGYDEAIELALLSFEYELSTGAIVGVNGADSFSGLREPGSPIPKATSAVHGITDADVKGHAIDPGGRPAAAPRSRKPAVQAIHHRAPANASGQMCGRRTSANRRRALPLCSVRSRR